MIKSQTAITLILFTITFTGFGQIKPIFYGGFDYYRDVGFIANSYLNLNVGSQLFRWKFIAPEIGYNYNFGVVRDNNELHPEDPNATAPSILRTRFSAPTFSIAPKIIIGNEEAAFVFLPQFNTGRITGKADLLRASGRNYSLEEQQRISNSISFWSFAAGVEGQFFDSDILHFSLLLKYHLLNSKSILEQIDMENSRLKSIGGSADGIGFSFRIYADLLQLLKKE